MTEESNTNLLSNAPDDFLEKPNTESDAKKIKPLPDERNVCVAVSPEETDGKVLMRLMSSLRWLCVPNQAMTDKHNIAVVFYLTTTKVRSRLGFCDELAASNGVFRVCKDFGVKATVYRDFGTPRQRQITEEDLGKHPFKF